MKTLTNLKQLEQNKKFDCKSQKKPDLLVFIILFYYLYFDMSHVKMCKVDLHAAGAHAVRGFMLTIEADQPDSASMPVSLLDSFWEFL